MKVNRGIYILERELDVLKALGDSATVERYKPHRVELHIRSCCKRHPHCGYKARCRSLWDKWSDNAPIQYSPSIWEDILMGALDNLPRLSLITFCNLINANVLEPVSKMLYGDELPDWKEEQRQYYERR